MSDRLRTLQKRAAAAASSPHKKPGSKGPQPKKPQPVSPDILAVNEFLAKLESYFEERSEITDKMIERVDKMLADVKQISSNLTDKQSSVHRFLRTKQFKSGLTLFINPLNEFIKTILVPLFFTIYKTKKRKTKNDLTPTPHPFKSRRISTTNSSINDNTAASSQKGRTV